MQSARDISRQIVPMTSGLAIVLLSSITVGIQFAFAAPKEVVIEKNVSAAGNGLGLKEFKKKLILSIGMSQARLFRMRNQIVRTSVADTGIAEPVVIAPNQLYIRGLSPGITSITLWDDVGAATHMELRVEKNHGLFYSTMAAFRDDIDQRLLPSGEAEAITSADPAELILEECVEVKDGNYQKQHNDSVPAVSKPSPKIKLPQEDVISFGADENDRVKIRTGFSSGNRKSTKTVNLTRSQSRVFLMKNGLESTTITNPEISEPIVVSKREIVVLGKSPGKSVLVLHDELGNEEVLDLRVSKNSNRLASTISKVRGILLNRILRLKTIASEIPSAGNETLELAEVKATKTIDLEPSRPRLFKSHYTIVRTAVSDPRIAETVVVSSTEIAMVGNAPGETTLFLWDDMGNISAHELSIRGKSVGVSKSASETEPDDTHSETPCEVECWFGSKKYVLNVRNTLISEYAKAPILSVISLDSLPQPKFCDRRVVTELNNEGVKALFIPDCDLAIRKLQAAMRMDPSYQRARSNLAIAYNNLGLRLAKQEPKEALKQFHNAIYLNPENETTVANLEGIIRILGRDPSDFEDRVDLGDRAVLADDIAGGIIEYKAALELRNDSKVSAKLNDLTSKIGRH